MLGELIAVFVTRLRWLFGQHDDLLGMAEEHRLILDAVAARDTDTLRWMIPGTSPAVRKPQNGA